MRRVSASWPRREIALAACRATAWFIRRAIVAPSRQVYERVDSANRVDSAVAFLRASSQDPLRALLVAPEQKEPFALLHSLTGESGF